MLDANNLASALERIIAGTHSDTDIQVLRQALQQGQLALATGERAVALGGDVNDTIIVTGDGNVVHIFKGPGAETIHQLFQQIWHLLGHGPCSRTLNSRPEPNRHPFGIFAGRSNLRIRSRAAD
jgi:hypothetical protein